MKLSIIIPVYNTSKYLPSCLDSVLKQDFEINKDFEIICVNDGSTDESAVILHNYAEKGVKVIDKANGGVSSARNLGLENAVGDYVWFVDSDDMVMPDIAPLLCQEIEDSAADMLSFKHIRCSESTSTPPHYKMLKINNLLNYCHGGA